MEKPKTGHESEEKETDVDRMLSECGAGYTITVKRIRPTWCAGILDKFDADPNNPVNILDLKEIYGGRQLLITIRDPQGLYKGSRMIQFPCGPREEGRPMEPDDVPGKGANQLDAVRDMAKMFLDSQKATSEAVTLILKGRIESLESQIAHRPEPTAAVPVIEPTSPIDVIRQSIETMKEIETLRETFGGGKQEQGADQGGGMVEDMIEQYFQMQMDKEKDKIARATSADTPEPPPDLPQRDHPAAQAAQAANAQAANAQAANAQATNAQSIDDLDDMELAIHMRERWAKMPKDQQEIALNIFMGNYTMEDLETMDEDTDEPESTGEGDVIDIGRPETDPEVNSIMSGVSLTDDDARTLEDGEDSSISSSRAHNGPIPPDPNVS